MEGWLAGGGDGPGRAELVATLAALVALGVAPDTDTLHDLVREAVPSPALPVVVVEVDGPLDAAAAVASAAGARRVVAALPAVHPLLAGVDPEPHGLAADRRGVVRRFGDTRLPLPEALRGLVHVSV